VKVFHTLSVEDQQEARGLAEARYRSNREAGVGDRKIGPQGASETDLEGIGGEFAFCRLFGVEPDRGISPRQGGADALIGGISVDVKTTKYERGALIVPCYALHQVMYYALMVGTFPTYRLAGVVPASVLKEAQMMNMGYGPVYGVEQGRLTLPREPVLWL
jgi:hypothetical protein